MTVIALAALDLARRRDRVQRRYRAREAQRPPVGLGLADLADYKRRCSLEWRLDQLVTWLREAEAAGDRDALDVIGGCLALLQLEVLRAKQAAVA